MPPTHTRKSNDNDEDDVCLFLVPDPIYTTGPVCTQLLLITQ